MCILCVGNPIYPATGLKVETVSTGLSLGGEILRLQYSSARGMPLNAGIKPDERPASGLGLFWGGNWHRWLEIGPGNKPVGLSSVGGHPVSLVPAGDGSYRSLRPQAIRVVASGSGFDAYDAQRQTVDHYGLDGRLQSSIRANGHRLQFSYSSAASPQAPAAGYLTAAADPFGRAVSFQYAAPQGPNPDLSQGRLTQVLGSAGELLALEYTSPANATNVATPAQLARLTWPDSVGKQFVYEDPNLPWALTGVFGEDGLRSSFFAYDSAGNAIKSEHAGGVDSFNVEALTTPKALVSEVYNAEEKVVYRYHSFDVPLLLKITGPMGEPRSVTTTRIDGRIVLTGEERAAGAGSPAATSAQGHDPNGNLAWREDFSGNKACYANDLTRNLEVVRVEGLAKGAACDSTAANAVLPAGSRKTSTQWHPDWHLPTRTAEPGRIVTKVYNGQSDPFAGGAIASCAPTDALLPDGKPIVVLCKEVEQATTDVDGSKGFAAVLGSTPARVQSWTYNSFGQVLTHDGPRTDVADISTYEYYASTDTNWTMGDLKQVTNPAGQITRFTQYNKAGKLLQSVDPNGVVTDSTYDLRQRLKSVTVAGATTAYDYYPTGLLKQVTEPDASWVGYEYDAAHRLVALKDNRGNRIDYTLDNAGKRTAEKVSDPQGALKRSAQRSFDALGRLEQLTGRE